jgi:hypothetical protein
MDLGKVQELVTRPEAPVANPLRRRPSPNAQPGAELDRLRRYLAEEVGSQAADAAIDELIQHPDVHVTEIIHVPGTLRWVLSFGRSPRPKQKWVTIPIAWFQEQGREPPVRNHVPLES